MAQKWAWRHPILDRPVYGGIGDFRSFAPLGSVKLLKRALSRTRPIDKFFGEPDPLCGPGPACRITCRGACQPRPSFFAPTCHASRLCFGQQFFPGAGPARLPKREGGYGQPGWVMPRHLGENSTLAPFFAEIPERKPVLSAEGPGAFFFSSTTWPSTGEAQSWPRYDRPQGAAGLGVGNPNGQRPPAGPKWPLAGASKSFPVQEDRTRGGKKPRARGGDKAVPRGPWAALPRARSGPLENRLARKPRPIAALARHLKSPKVFAVLGAGGGPRRKRRWPRGKIGRGRTPVPPATPENRPPDSAARGRFFLAASAAARPPSGFRKRFPGFCMSAASPRALPLDSGIFRTGQPLAHWAPFKSGSPAAPQFQGGPAGPWPCRAVAQPAGLPPSFNHPLAWPRIIGPWKEVLARDPGRGGWQAVLPSPPIAPEEAALTRSIWANRSRAKRTRKVG